MCIYILYIFLAVPNTHSYRHTEKNSENEKADNSFEMRAEEDRKAAKKEENLEER